MLKTKTNKLIIRHEKARKQKLISKIQFEIQLEDEIKLNQLLINLKFMDYSSGYNNLSAAELDGEVLENQDDEE